MLATLFRPGERVSRGTGARRGELLGLIIDEHKRGVLRRDQMVGEGVANRLASHLDIYFLLIGRKLKRSLALRRVVIT
jgi:hypothetical protein